MATRVYTFSGWVGPCPATVTVHVGAGEMKAALADLKADGFRPRVVFDRTAEGCPLCPKHGVPMPLRESKGDTWHSHVLVDFAAQEERYCRGYRGPNSPGYDAPKSFAVPPSGYTPGDVTKAR